jgi:hypothetical protein
MTNAQLKPSLTREYWTYNVGDVTGPVAQFRMSQLVDYDLRLTDPARTVYRFLIGWYMRSNGDALASVRHIVAIMRARAPDGARHLSRSAVQRAIVLLIDAGWLVRTHVGKGRGASRFVPVLNVLELATQGTLPSAEKNSVPPYRDTNDGSVASHSTGTDVSHSTGTLEALASHSSGTKTLLPDPRTDAETGKEDNDCAPPADGLSATAVAQEGFDELYVTYGVKKDKTAARHAYEKLAPDAGLHARMVEAASAWRQAAGGIERMHLARWIREERYDEDPKGERKAKAKASKPEPTAEPEPANDNIPDFMIGSPSLWPVGRHIGTFVAGHIEKHGGSDEEVTMDFETTAGDVFKHRFYSQAYIKSFQEQGQKIIGDIVYAVGLQDASDTDDFLFKPLVAIADGRTIQYLPLNAAEAA